MRDRHMFEPLQAVLAARAASAATFGATGDLASRTFWDLPVAVVVPS